MCNPRPVRAFQTIADGSAQTPDRGLDQLRPGIDWQHRRPGIRVRLSVHVSITAVMDTTAIYARISEDRADGAGVDRQLKDCRALVQRHRWGKAREFTD